jgi:hypothetical protein
MMRKTNLMLCVAGLFVVATSTAAEAQGRRGGGQRRGGQPDEGGRGALETKVLGDDDLDKVDPGKVLLEKAKALKLSDAQKHGLDSVVTRYEWNAHQFAKDVDSLVARSRRERMAARLGGGDASASPDSGGTQERAAHKALLDALQSIRDEFEAASSHSLERLTDDQRKQAHDWLQDARTKLDQLLSRA